MTLGELASALDMSPVFLGYLEQGARRIDRRTELAVRYVAVVCQRSLVQEDGQSMPAPQGSAFSQVI